VTLTDSDIAETSGSITTKGDVTGTTKATDNDTPDSEVAEGDITDTTDGNITNATHSDVIDSNTSLAWHRYAMPWTYVNSEH
jgi:hypothetical protein